MQKNTFALLFLFIFLPLFFICNDVSAPYYDEYGNLVPDGSEHEQWRATQGSRLFDDRFAMAQRSNPFDDQSLYDDFSPRPVRRQQFDDEQFDQRQYYDGSQVDTDRTLQRFNLSRRWLEEVAAGDHSSRTFQDFESRQLMTDFYGSVQQQRVALMFDDQRSMEDDIPYLSGQAQRLRIQELEEEGRFLKEMRKSYDEREAGRISLRSSSPRYAETFDELDELAEEIDAQIKRKRSKKGDEELRKTREKHSKKARDAAEMEVEAAKLHPRTIIQRMQDQLGAGAFKKATQKEPDFLEKKQAEIIEAKKGKQKVFKQKIKKLMADENSDADSFTALFLRSKDNDGNLKQHADLSTSALFTYVRTAAETTEELQAQLKLLKAKTSPSADDTAEIDDLEKSLKSMEKLRKGLSKRIAQERTDAQKRLVAAKKRAEAANKKVISETEVIDEKGKKKTVKRSHKEILTYAQKAVQNEVDRLSELKKLNSKKTVSTKKRGALFGGEDQRIATATTNSESPGQRKLVQDSRAIILIGNEVQRRAQGEKVKARPTRLAPKAAGH